MRVFRFLEGQDGPDDEGMDKRWLNSSVKRTTGTTMDELFRDMRLDWRQELENNNRIENENQPIFGQAVFQITQRRGSEQKDSDFVVTNNPKNITTNVEGVPSFKREHGTSLGLQKNEEMKIESKDGDEDEVTKS